MDRKTELKLIRLIEDWRMGNYRDAGRVVKSLKKVELVKLLTQHHRLPNGFIGVPELRVRFEDFVLRTLELA